MRSAEAQSRRRCCDVVTTAAAAAAAAELLLLLFFVATTSVVRCCCCEAFILPLVIPSSSSSSLPPRRRCQRQQEQRHQRSGDAATLLRTAKTTEQKAQTRIRRPSGSSCLLDLVMESEHNGGDGSHCASSSSSSSLPLLSRREAFWKGIGGTSATASAAAAAAAVVGGFVVGTSCRPEPAHAFSNKISNKYDDRPKRRGPKPQDLGVSKRTTVDGYDTYVGLKGCGPAPNCFSSTITNQDDEDHSIPAWTYPKDYDKQKALKELIEVLKSYPPGQNGVDGGGFEIQIADVQKGYVYVQYESLKNGYIDDVEFAVIEGYPDRSVQVRSSSRIGYLDYGVNAKRLNWIAEAMRSKGWDAEGVDDKSHPFYAAENRPRD